MKRLIVTLVAVLFAGGTFACNVGHGTAGADPAPVAKKQPRKAVKPDAQKRAAAKDKPAAAADAHDH